MKSQLGATAWEAKAVRTSTRFPKNRPVGSAPVGPERDSAPPMNTCATCQHFAPLKPGHAAICFERWRGLPWNAAVPLTTADDSCEKHARRDGEQAGAKSEEPK